MEKPGREKEVRGKKRDGQQRKEKGIDGNGKNERIYPLENEGVCPMTIQSENKNRNGLEGLPSKPF